MRRISVVGRHVFCDRNSLGDRLVQCWCDSEDEDKYDTDKELPCDKAWSSLSDAERAAAKRLGFMFSSEWDDSTAEVLKVPWADLSDEQSDSATTLGFDEDSWSEEAAEEEITLAGQLPVDPWDVGLDPTHLERLRSLVRDTVDRGQWPHVVTIVGRCGQLCFADVYEGAAEVESEQPQLDPDTSLFRIYSQTKPIVAAATLALVDRGLLSLDDPISKHLPEFADAASQDWPTVPLMTEGPKARERPAAGPPTVRHLLTHSAGIMPLDFDQMINRLVSSPGWRSASYSERLRFVCVEISKQPLLHDPGADFLYAIQFDILGRVLEVAGNSPLDALLEDLIFKPCGMDSTFFQVPADRAHDLRRCYVPASAGLLDASDQVGFFKTYSDDGLGYFGGSEGLVSSAADFFRFATMLLDKGVCAATGRRVLSEEAVSEMTQNQVPGGGDMSAMPSAGSMGLKRSGFGLGVSVALRPNGEGRGGESYNPLGCGIGEYGWGGAANTHYFASPADGNILVLFFTQVLRDPSMGKIGSQLHRAVYGALASAEASK